MPISFNTIPSNLRPPLFYAELDNSQANIFQPNLRVLLMGQIGAGGTATANELVLVSGADEADGLFDTDSELHKMVAAYRANDTFGELWCLPLADGGGSDPVLTTAIANLGDEVFDFIASPFRESASLTALAALMNDAAGRWSPYRQIYGHVYMAAKDTVANLQTLGTGAGLNNQHFTVFGVEASVAETEAEYIAARVGREAVFLRADPARPTQTGPIYGITAADLADRFTISERQTLLTSGIATHYTDSAGVVRIERSITTYRENAFSAPDISYLDSETMHQSARLLRELKSIVTSKFARVKLADDGTRFGRGHAIVTPKIVYSEIVAMYARLENIGLVENADAALAATIVERNAGDPNRIDVLFAPDYVNQLRIFAVLLQFRLQFADTTAAA